MRVKRLRIFAGPNGSGKTTIINQLKDSISFGVYVNADDIEKAFIENGFIHLKDYQLSVTASKLKKHFLSTNFSQSKSNKTDIWQYLSVKNNKIFITAKKQTNSYLAADFVPVWLNDLNISSKSLFNFYSLWTEIYSIKQLI